MIVAGRAYSSRTGPEGGSLLCFARPDSYRVEFHQAWLMEAGEHAGSRVADGLCALCAH